MLSRRRMRGVIMVAKARRAYRVVACARARDDGSAQNASCLFMVFLFEHMRGRRGGMRGEVS